MNVAPVIHRLHRSQGFAIPAAIFVIIVVSLLALAGLYVAQNNATANVGIARGQEALYAADAGATQVIGTWNRSEYRMMNPGDSIDTGWRTLPDGSEYRTSILRVDDDVSGSETLFRLRTVGRPGQSVAAQRVLVYMVRVLRADVMCCESAIKLQGGLRLQGTGAGVKVSGIDSPPAVWGSTCPPDRTDLPGVLMQDAGNLEIVGNPVLEGAPPVDEDPAIVGDDFVQFGDVDYTDLARMADKHLAGEQVITNVQSEVSEGQCAEWVSTNWGEAHDPASPCFEYMPVIHADGNVHISGSAYGQGILLIDGNLTVSGTFDFYGIVIVQGEADFRGTTNLNGAILVRNGATAGEDSWLRGGTTLQYSSCSATRALQQALVAEPLAGRHWFEVLE
jgi:hypothetical protein